MGILPLQFLPGQNVESLRLTGEEIFDIVGLKDMLDSKFADGNSLCIVAENEMGKTIQFSATVRIDTPQEILYYENGGILQYVLRQLAAKN
jgi:aconitate hydratase